MENQSVYWGVYPYKQQLIDAQKHKHESLAQWAARLTKLGENSGCEDVLLLDMLLRDKFVTGLDPGPLRDFFEPRTDIHELTYKQVLDLAFTTAARFDMEAKKKVLQQELVKKTV